MSGTLVLILIVASAYLATHIVFEWLARRYRLVSGAEYLLLGVLLGPQVSDLISADILGNFAPFLTLALGWVGILVGTQFVLPELVRIRAVVYQTAFLESFISLAAVGGLMAFVLHQALELTWQQALLSGAVMGAVATVSAPSGIALAARVWGRRGAAVRQLEVTTGIQALVAVVVFALVLSIGHPGVPGLMRSPTATEWMVISIGIGCIGGALFHLFLGDERKVDRLFIGLAGATILASGAAAYMRLSPLLPTLLVGAILVNTSDSRLEIRQVLRNMERPLYFVLLLFAGAAWEPGGVGWIVPALAYLPVRAATKVWGARLAAWLSGVSHQVGPDWGRALLAQGGLAVAIALNYRLHDASLVPNVIFTATLIAVLVTDLISARLAETVVARPAERPAGTRSANGSTALATKEG